MKAIAFVCTYQEADIIGRTVRHLKWQGCDVLVIDCHSTDGTRQLARLSGAQTTTWPSPPVSFFALLTHIEKLAEQSTEYDWCVLCDADELRYSDVPGETLAEGFARVQAAGYNAIDHQIATFHPTAESAAFDGSQDPEQYFRWYSGDPLNQRLGQVKAWRNSGEVSLAASGGHQARFVGRWVYPGKFLSKHYPIRSQAHGERKVFRERNWLDRAQGRMNWHVQYEGITPGYSFIRDRATLSEWKRCRSGRSRNDNL